jgi:hypothetical protein
MNAAAGSSVAELTIPDSINTADGSYSGADRLEDGEYSS